MAKLKTKPTSKRKRMTKADREQFKLRRTAIHEAGHAVAYIELGISKFRYVTIVAEGDNLGHLRPYKTTLTTSASGRLNDREIARNELHAVSLLCGYAAETVLAGVKYNPWQLVLGSGQHDFKACFEAVAWRFPDWQGFANAEGSDVREAYREYLWQRARHFVAVHGPKVIAIADALLTHKKLSYRQCEGIALSAVPSQEHHIRVCRMMGMKESDIAEVHGSTR